MGKTYLKPATISGNKTNRKINIEDVSMLDDDFFSSILDKSTKRASLILQIILNKKDLVVKEITTQKKLTSIDNKSIILDANAVDSNNKQYNIEIQKVKQKDIILRARFHLSILDTYNLKKSKNFSSIPETYIIFICDFDLFKENKPIYVVERYVNHKYLFNDLEHIIFVNCKYNKEDSDIGKLIHDIKGKVGERKWYNVFEISKEEGEKKMGQNCERIRQEGYKLGIEVGYKQGEENVTTNHIISMLKEGLGIELISDITKKNKEDILSFKEKYKL